MDLLLSHHQSILSSRLRSNTNHREEMTGMFGGVSLRTRLPILLAALALVFVAAHADNIGVCIRNCAQCKKMFGPYFEGQLCADSCVKFKGKIIPDCEDVASIAPFLNKFE